MKTLSFCYVITLLAFVFALPLSLQAQVLQWERFPILDSVYDAQIDKLEKTRFSLFTNTNNKQMLYSRDKGRSWQKAMWKGRSGDSAIFPGVPSALWFCETPSRLFIVSVEGLCVSLDSGASWEIISGVLTDSGRNNEVMTFGNVVALGSVLFNNRGFFGSYLSRDYGKTWQSFLPNSIIATIEREDDEIVAYTHDIFDYTHNSRIRVVSRDTGKTWQVDNGVPLPVRRNDGTHFIRFDKNFFFVEQRTFFINHGVSDVRFQQWISKDSGRTWNDLVLLNSREYALFDHVLVGSTLFFSTTQGIFTTRDQGETWQKESGTGSLPNSRFIRLTLDGLTLYATVERDGVYRADVSSLTSVVRAYNHDIGGAYSLFPNPTSERAELTFTLPRSGRARLALYSALGVEVWRSEEALFAAGEGRIVIDARGLPTGVYMYRLSADGAGVSVGRVVVAR